MPLKAPNSNVFEVKSEKKMRRVYVCRLDLRIRGIIHLTHKHPKALTSAGRSPDRIAEATRGVDHGLRRYLPHLTRHEILHHSTPDLPFLVLRQPIITAPGWLVSRFVIGRHRETKRFWVHQRT